MNYAKKIVDILNQLLPEYHITCRGPTWISISRASGRSLILVSICVGPISWADHIIDMADPEFTFENLAIDITNVVEADFPYTITFALE